MNIVPLALALAACRAPAGPPAPPREAPREALAAYDLDGLRVEGAPPIDPAIGRALARHEDLPWSRLLDVSSDGRRVLAIVDGACVELGSPDGAPREVAGELDVGWARYGDGDRVAVTADRDGDELAALYVAGGGAPAPLAVPPGIVDPIWDRARGRLIHGLVTGALWTVELATGVSRRVLAEDGLWSPLDVSPDGGFVLARRERSSAESALYRVNLEHGSAVALTPVGGAAATAGRFGPHGELFAISDAGRDRLGLDAIEPRGRRALTAELAGDVTAFAVSGDGATIAFVTADDGVSTLRLLDVATGAHRVAPGAPAGGVITDLHFAAGAPVLGFSFTDPARPRAAYTYELGSARLVRWTAPVAAPPAIAPRHELIASSAGVQVSLLAYLPRRARAPVVIDLHGGPEDQWLPRHDGFVQFLVDRGYAVIRPDVRGSAGHGRAFAALDDGPRRAAVVDDVRAVLDWIATRPELDATRVAVTGTSYGGYLALAALIAEPDRLRGGAVLGAIGDLVAFLEGTSAYRRDHRRAEYGDERDPATRAALAASSPVARPARLRRPLLVAHGARDPRVPVAIAERLVAAVRAAGTPVWSAIAADEGHVFTGSGNRRAYEILVTQLLDRILGR